MIPPVPPSFGFSLLAIPVWRWEETPAPATDATPPPDINRDACGDAVGENGATAASLPEKRQVFIGYEWRSSVEWSLFPDAPWEHAFDDQVGEIREGALRHEREQQQGQQRTLASAPNGEARAALHHNTTNKGSESDVPAATSQASRTEAQ